MRTFHQPNDFQFFRGRVSHASSPPSLCKLLLIFFAGVMPTSGMKDPFLLADGFWAVLSDRATPMVLPVTTIALTLFAENALIVRSTMLGT